MMKKFTLLFALFLSIISCTKEFPDQGKIDHHFKYFSFETEEEYRDFMNEEDPLNTIVMKTNYMTLQSIMDNALIEIENCKSLYEFEKAVKNSNETLLIITDSNGDLNIVESKIRFHPLFPILNQHGIVKIENRFFKFLDDYLFISDVYEDLSIIHDAEQPLENGVVKKLAIKIIPLGIHERWGDINVPYGDEIIVDNPYCKNDRMIIFEQMLNQVYNYFDDPFLGPITEARNTLLSEVKARRKGIPCIWYPYNTAITWNNFYNEYDFVFKGTYHYGNIWDGNDQYVASTKKIVRDKYLGSYLLEFDTYDFQWTIIQTDATHQGMGGVWLNYYYEL